MIYWQTNQYLNRTSNFWPCVMCSFTHSLKKTLTHSYYKLDSPPSAPIPETAWSVIPKHAEPHYLFPPVSTDQTHLSSLCSVFAASNWSSEPAAVQGALSFSSTPAQGSWPSWKGQAPGWGGVEVQDPRQIWAWAAGSGFGGPLQTAEASGKQNPKVTTNWYEFAL